MATIACLIMMKNEQTLIEPWLLYHADLFGMDNLYVFDNGSTDAHSLAILEKYESQGLNVDRFFTTPSAYAHKGDIIGVLVKSLDGLNKYDFFVPLDCDEFLMLRDPGSESGYTSSKDRIISYFDSIDADEGRILKVRENLTNVLGHAGLFKSAFSANTIYPRNSLVETDHGYQNATSSRAPGYREVDLAYAHFHYRPYEELIQVSREKLRMALTDGDMNNKVTLSNFKGRGSHLVEYFMNDAETYYGRFRHVPTGILLPELTERFSALGVSVPFSDFELPKETARNLVIDSIEHDWIQGWARDRTNPRQPLFTQLLLDNVPFVEMICDEPRADVMADGYETDQVGFRVRLPEAVLDGSSHRLSARDLEGNGIPLSLNNVMFQSIEVSADAFLPVRSHIDGVTDGGVEGWVLNSQDGAELQGGCSVILVNGSKVIAETVADLERRDVSAVLGGDPNCGFRFELPNDEVAGDLSIYVMPGMRPLHGSPFDLNGTANISTRDLPSELLVAAAGTPTLVAA